MGVGYFAKQIDYFNHFPNILKCSAVGWRCCYCNYSDGTLIAVPVNTCHKSITFTLFPVLNVKIIEWSFSDLFT